MDERQENGQKPPDLEELETGEGDDTTYGSEFAYQANQIEDSRWRLYNTLIGAALGLVMGAILFAIPTPALADSVRLVIVFAIGMLPAKLIESRAERSVKTGRTAMAIAFVACMAAFALYLLLR